MNKSVIVYGPQGCGKSRYAQRIAKHFGLQHVADGIETLSGEVYVKGDNSLILVNSYKDQAIKSANGLQCYSFAEVAQRINAAIPMTDWFPPDVKPVNEGVYETGIVHIGDVLQHWNGDHWGGYAYTIEKAQEDSCHPSGYQKNKWRGLAEEPLPVGA